MYLSLTVSSSILEAMNSIVADMSYIVSFPYFDDDSPTSVRVPKIRLRAYLIMSVRAAVAFDDSISFGAAASPV